MRKLLLLLTCLLMCCCSAQEYWDGKIKRHEFTRKDKEEDRLKHVDMTNCNAGPVFLTYPARDSINALIDETKTRYNQRVGIAKANKNKKPEDDRPVIE